MKLITAYVHHNRVGKIVDTLGDAGFRNFALVDVRGTLPPLNVDEQQYSKSSGRMTTAEARFELVCEDDDVKSVVALIQTHGRIGSGVSGMLYVSPIEEVILVGEAT